MSRKYVMVNEITGFGILNLFILVILNENIIKCVINFGRLVRISKDQWKG
jgi:hypothetical protein